MNELTAIEQKASAEIVPLIEKVKAVVIRNEAEYIAANQLVLRAREVIAVSQAEIQPVKEANTKAWQASNALWKKYVSDPLDIVTALDRRAYQWRKAEEKRIADENEKARREAERAQEEERLKVAEKLEDLGMKEQAEAVLDAPAAPVKIAEQVAPTKAVGTVAVENWQARIVDADAVPREYCSPDTVKIGRYAKLMKGKASIPGVVFEDIGTVRRSKS